MKYLNFWLIALACSGTAWAQTGSQTAHGGHATHAEAIDWTRGKIVKIETNNSSVVLNHRRIKSIGMAAMTMPFKVEDMALMSKLKVGDSVRFTVKEKADHLFIDRLEKTK